MRSDLALPQISASDLTGGSVHLGRSDCGLWHFARPPRRLALGVHQRHPCDAADQRGECTRLAIDISDREWVTDLLRGAACRRLAGGVWFSELKFPRKWNPHRPIGVGSGPRQLLLNLPPGSSRRRPVWSAAV